jgi:RES domain-containing protein
VIAIDRADDAADVHAFRLIRERYAADVLRGVGAARVGGRRNPIGVPVAYCAESLELAVLELLVNTRADLLPLDYVMFEFVVPDDAMRTVDLRELAADWDVGPPYPETTRRCGARWAHRRESLALRVPSAVLPLRGNVLINPVHADFACIKSKALGYFQWPRRMRR